MARAIVAAPLLALVDEPMAGLDALARASLRDLLRTFRSDEGPAMLLITADFAVAQPLAGTAFVMAEGRIVEREPVSAMIRAPKEDATRRFVEALSAPAGRGLPPAVRGG